jgi:hypothetical protein
VSRGLRDAIAFLTGVGGIIYEATIHSGGERWGLIVAYLTMMQLPFAFRWDERRNGHKAPPATPPLPEDVLP